MKDITLVHLILLALATYRVTRLIVEDTILETLRNAIWDKVGYERGIGYLLTCYWCSSFWVASLFVTTYIIVPIPTIAVSAILALSAFSGLMAAWMDRK